MWGPARDKRGAGATTLNSFIFHSPLFSNAFLHRESKKGVTLTVACKGAWLNGGGDCSAVAFLYIPLGSLLLDARK